MTLSASASQKALAWAVPLWVEAAALARSVLLARLIGPEELGRAMLLALVLRLVEMLSDMSVERLLVQAKDGDDAQVQARLQAALIVRGVAMAALLLALAPALAAGFGDGPSVLAYALLALVPLLRGALHLDYRRAERGFHYRGLALVEGGAAVAMLVTAAAASLVPGADHRVLLAALVAQALAQLTLSHLVAHRAYALDFAREGLQRVWLFGAPLALNAGLMFLTLQADRLLVAGAWGWSAMAIYGIVAQLAFLPAQIVGRAATALLLPRFRIAAQNGDLPEVLHRAMIQAVSLAVVFGVVFGALASPGIAVGFGSPMAPGLALSAALGAAAALRILRTPLSVLAVATGRTGDPARANLWRAAALIPAVAVAALGLPLAALAATAALGEAAAALRGWHLSRINRQPEVFA